MEFDRIYAEVDLGRIEENMKAMKEHLRPGTKMYGVVKTDANRAKLQAKIDHDSGADRTEKVGGRSM